MELPRLATGTGLARPAKHSSRNIREHRVPGGHKAEVGRVRADANESISDIADTG